MTSREMKTLEFLRTLEEAEAERGMGMEMVEEHEPVMCALRGCPVKQRWAEE